MKSLNPEINHQNANIAVLNGVSEYANKFDSSFEITDALREAIVASVVKTFNPKSAFGVGAGQGTWHNNHFTTLADAEQFFTDHLAQVEGSFARGGKYEVKEEPLPEDDEQHVKTEVRHNLSRLLKRVTVTNIKKNGKPGSLRYTLHLYRYTRPCCTFACTACDSLKTA